MSNEIVEKVKQGKIYLSCFDCAEKYRDRPMYNGTFTVREGICEICGEKKSVTSASKLFGFHKFL